MEPLLSLGIALSAAGVGMLRASWGRRKPVLAASAWAALVLGTIASAAVAGAWGIAVAWLVATLIAGLLLARAVVTAPAGRAAAGREPLTTETWRFQASDLWRRLAVFALVVPVGFAAAQLFAFGAQAAARRAGWAEADTIVVALLGQPIVWTILASIQITRRGPLRMIAPALVCALLGAILWWPL
ncbi:hypothetical protein ACMGDH_13515 [Sphingomonas sp. DT-207]|uniref:hypothetical protein n=1 Tax=Sphingomonas sp. DT-207 TaxID=3396167 RepID=UPI003F1B0C98